MFDELALLGVNRKAIILTTSMVLAGSKQPKSMPEEVAKATVDTLVNHVPHDVAGIVFLSGGQTPNQATANLRAITDLGPQVWPITFSFSRALQEPVIATWGGNDEHADNAQHMFKHLVDSNSNATVLN